MAERIFPQSRELKDIIESYGWTLYDVTRPTGQAFTWEEIDGTSPADQFEVGHNYLFVPIPKSGEPLRQAYTPTKGLGPSITIDDVSDERWLSVYVQRKKNGFVALFSRLVLVDECAFVMTPHQPWLPETDFVAIKYELLVDTFRKHFRIVSPAAYGATVPIPMPPIPEVH